MRRESRATAHAALAARIPYEPPVINDDVPAQDPETEKQLRAADHRVFFAALKSAVTPRP